MAGRLAAHFEAAKKSREVERSEHQQGHIRLEIVTRGPIIPADQLPPALTRQEGKPNA